MLSRLFLGGSNLTYFVQVLPVSLLAAAIFAAVRFRLRMKRQLRADWYREGVLTVFACYLTGLLSLVWTPGNLWNYLWYYAFYGYPGTEIGRMFVFEYNFVPSVFRYWSGELTGGSWTQFMALGNVLMFVPLGLLLPLVSRRIRWQNMAPVFLGCSLVIELVQPVFGRSFDVDDLIYNTVGGIIGFLLYALVRALFPHFAARCQGGRSNQ